MAVPVKVGIANNMCFTYKPTGGRMVEKCRIRLHWFDKKLSNIAQSMAVPAKVGIANDACFTYKPTRYRIAEKRWIRLHLFDGKISKMV